MSDSVAHIELLIIVWIILGIARVGEVHFSDLGYCWDDMSDSVTNV